MTGNHPKKKLLLSRHLDLEYLEFMIREIYIKYGLIFREAEEYSGRKNRDSLISENVDQFLTETDKKNI